MRGTATRPDADDACGGTVLPDQPLVELKRNRFAANAGGEFVDGDGNPSGITVADTGVCSATQLIDALGLGARARKFGLLSASSKLSSPASQADLTKRHRRSLRSAGSRVRGVSGTAPSHCRAAVRDQGTGAKGACRCTS